MTHSNHYLFVLAFLFFSLLSKAQFNNEMYDKECFLIGTLDENMGYQRVFVAGNDDLNYHKVDIFVQNELKNALFMDSLYNSDYKDIYIVNNGTSKGIKLYSSTLSSKIDKYYNYQPTCYRTINGDTIYTGELRKEMLKTEKQKLSFLLGAFLRFGICETKDGKPGHERLAIQANAPNSPYIHLIDMMDPEKKCDKCIKYCFNTPNAPVKAIICADLLKEFGCEEVEYISYEDYYPVPHFAIFKPSQKIQEIIDYAEILKNQITGMKTDHIKFTPDGTKYIWVDPKNASISKQYTSYNR